MVVTQRVAPAALWPSKPAPAVSSSYKLDALSISGPVPRDLLFARNRPAMALTAFLDAGDGALLIDLELDGQLAVGRDEPAPKPTCSLLNYSLPAQPRACTARHRG